jgi:hypothetical protein
LLASIVARTRWRTPLRTWRVRSAVRAVRKRPAAGGAPGQEGKGVGR